MADRPKHLINEPIGELLLDLMTSRVPVPIVCDCIRFQAKGCMRCRVHSALIRESSKESEKAKK